MDKYMEQAIREILGLKYGIDPASLSFLEGYSDTHPVILVRGLNFLLECLRGRKWCDWIAHGVAPL